jgi:Sensors of blue-light using FAD
VPVTQRQILYLSHLVPSASYDVFAAICQVSRTHNEQHGIAGVLLFDGHRFCQWLEGPTDAVLQTMQRIRCDRRHEAVVMLLDREVERESHANHWQSGYCEPDELDCFEGPDAARGEAALTAFQDIVTRADLAP